MRQEAEVRVRSTAWGFESDMGLLEGPGQRVPNVSEFGESASQRY